MHLLSPIWLKGQFEESKFPAVSTNTAEPASGRCRNPEGIAEVLHTVETVSVWLWAGQLTTGNPELAASSEYVYLPLLAE